MRQHDDIKDRVGETACFVRVSNPGDVQLFTERTPANEIGVTKANPKNRRLVSASHRRLHVVSRPNWAGTNPRSHVCVNGVNGKWRQSRGSARQMAANNTVYQLLGDCCRPSNDRIAFAGAGFLAFFDEFNTEADSVFEEFRKARQD